MGVAQYHDGHRGILKELRAEVLGIGELLKVELIVNNHKLPRTLALRRG